MLYNNRILFILVAIFSFSTIFAQNERKDIRYKVFATDLECKEPRWVKEGYTTLVFENILTNLKATKRVNAYTEGSAANATKATKDANIKLEKSGSDEFMWDAIGFEKPDYTVSGILKKVTFIKLGIKGYQAVVGYSVKVTEVSSGDVDQADFLGQKAKPEMTKASALPAALKLTNEAAQEWFKSFFSLRTTVFKVQDATKTSAKTIKIQLGTSSGIAKNNQFIVHHVEYEDGVEIDSNPIGMVKVKSVGNKTTLCQVTKGGKEILSLFDASNKAALVCELKTKR
tara:strand:+ start:106 stop:960 length:855 start_codon:yes stop_codon:yes gene_type:complete